MDTGTTCGAREQKKRETRVAIEDAAWRLFARQGYDDTTVDDIATAADVAPRTFFRYFESKEAVLFGDWRSGLEEMRTHVLERPENEPPLDRLRIAMLAFSESFQADRAVHLQRRQIAIDSPHAGSYQRHVVVRAWEDTLAEAVAAVLGVNPSTDIRPHLHAGVAVAAVSAAVAVWMAGQGRDALPDLLAAAFDELAAATAPTERP